MHTADWLANRHKIRPKWQADLRMVKQRVTNAMVGLPYGISKEIDGARTYSKATMHGCPCPRCACLPATIAPPDRPPLHALHTMHTYTAKNYWEAQDVMSRLEQKQKADGGSSTNMFGQWATDQLKAWGNVLKAYRKGNVRMPAQPKSKFHGFDAQMPFAARLAKLVVCAPNLIVHFAS